MNELDEAGWKLRERRLAVQTCVNTHRETFLSTVGPEGMVKNADAACHVCIGIAEARIKKEQKAQGVRITDPDEIARTLQELGTEDTIPGVPLDDDHHDGDTIPDPEDPTEAGVG